MPNLSICRNGDMAIFIGKDEKLRECKNGSKVIFIKQADIENLYRDPPNVAGDVPPDCKMPETEPKGC